MPRAIALEVAIRRGEHAHIGSERASTAEPLILALLQHAQKLRLHGRTHLRDFVEEQHAARGLLDLARVHCLRARERAALVAEQLGFEQLFGQRRAVERDERTLSDAASRDE